jgi:hypothetical protein
MTYIVDAECRKSHSHLARQRSGKTVGTRDDLTLSLSCEERGPVISAITIISPPRRIR